MTRDLFVAKFEGGKADEHKLPAYMASKSLYGISRSLLLITNYLEEGKIRHRSFDPKAFELNILTQRKGSYETVFEIASDPTALAIYAGTIGGVSSHFIVKFIESIINRTIGHLADPEIEELEAKGKLASGDLTALTEAVEPALRSTHEIIGNGVTNITIINGDRNIVKYNQKTKNYVNQSKKDNIPRIKLFSIASFNANSGNGRAYDYDECRTIPFLLSNDADRATINSVLKSMSSYAMHRRLGDELKSAIAFKYRVYESIDGRVKKILLDKARDSIHML